MNHIGVNHNRPYTILECQIAGGPVLLCMMAFHTVNGYVNLKTQDFRMSPASPPLVREWMAWSWLFKNPSLDLGGRAWEEADSTAFGMKFFYDDILPYL